MSMKTKSFVLLTISAVFFLALALIINILFRTNNYLYLINILLVFILIFFYVFLIFSLFVKPIKRTIKYLKYYNDGNCAPSLLPEQIRELNELNQQITTLTTKMKQLEKQYQEVLNENTTYYEQYKLDLENKKQLVASISHEIKTPLAVIEATASGILDDIFSEEDKIKELNNIISECDKTTIMLQEIVNIYKIDSTNYNLEAKNINLRDLIEETLNFYAPLITKYQKEISILGSLDFTYPLNAIQFKKVLANVILNAIIYSPRKEKITIEIKETPNYHVLEIINYGITIAKDDLKKVFEPFYRVDKSRTKKEDHGNGLGLYIVKEILEKHQLDYGLINLNNGVKFYIIFPILIPN